MSDESLFEEFAVIDHCVLTVGHGLACYFHRRKGADHKWDARIHGAVFLWELVSLGRHLLRIHRANRDIKKHAA